MQKLAAEFGMTSLFPLRLVSKAWNDAFKDYSGDSRIIIEGESDLQRLITIMPNTSSLLISISSGSVEVSLSPLKECRQLTGLQLSYDSTEQHSEGTFMGIDSLPTTLKALSLRRAYAPPESFAEANFPAVTTLDYLIPRHRDGETCIVSELLQRMPSLKVILVLHTSFGFCLIHSSLGWLSS